MVQPVFNAFTTRKYKDGSEEKTHWIQIGAVFPHRNGKGYDVVLDALPVDGRIVLLEPKEKPPAE